MSTLDKKTIAKLTKLSRIDCTDQEQDALLNDLKKIIDYIEQLQEVNTDNVSPCNHVLADIVNVMREDIAGPTLPRDEFIANAPSHIGGLIRVPPILKNNNS